MYFLNCRLGRRRYVYIAGAWQYHFDDASSDVIVWRNRDVTAATNQRRLDDRFRPISGSGCFLPTRVIFCRTFAIFSHKQG